MWDASVRLVLAVLAVWAGPAQAAEISLDRAIVPATGQQQVTVTVAKYGRYSFSAHGSEGTALQLVDRMAGFGEAVGVPGGSDGRLDVFLDRGTYRLIASSDAKGTGEVHLEAHAFAEQNGEPPLLPPLRAVETSLEDYQRRTWWIEVKAGQPLAIEAAGRSLVDLRLWRDGSWLSEVRPACTTVEATPKKPVTNCQITGSTQPGLYQLVAYGGAPMQWAEGGDGNALYVRSGIPTIPEVSRGQHVVSPFGTDRWLVPGSASFFRMELPKPEEATLTVRTHEPAQALRTNGASTSITTKSLLPVAEVSTPNSAPFRTVIVTASAGQPYVLQSFKAGFRETVLSGDGAYWISTVHAGTPGDAIDVTGLLTPVPKPPDRSTPAPLATSVVTATHTLAWRRRFELLEPASIFLDVKEAGTYTASLDGIKGRLRVEPLLSSRPAGYKAPPWDQGRTTVQLTPGFWSVAMEPDQKGVATITVAGSAAGAGPDTPVLAGVQFPEVKLEKGASYLLTLNQQPGVRFGIVQRKLPVDLEEALPLSLLPREAVAVRASMRVRGTLRARLEDGTFASISVDGGGWSSAPVVGPGEHRVSVRQDGGRTVFASLALELPEAPLPRVPEAALDALPNFPVLSEQTPRFTDLGRELSATFALRVDEPGLYRVESTGLLATAGALRTRIVPSFAESAQNGVGRNFLLGQYLREGDYQVTVTTQGESAGHLGVALRRVPLRDGGSLVEGVPARASLGADEGLAYRFSVEKEGDYSLESLGQRGAVAMRLEDADGWPVTTPEVSGGLEWHFLPGKYRVIVLPQPAAGRRVTLLQRHPEPVVRTGHGPHALPIDTPVSHVWRESEERTPDRWTFTLAAPVDVTISAGDAMTGDLVRGDAVVGRIVPAHAWTGRLEAGDYHLDLTNSRRDDRAAYELVLRPTQLMPGVRRALSAPGSVPVAIGTEGLFSIASFGTSDVRARLYDAAGQLVAENDDRPDDWNFEIARRLRPGEYRLDVAPVGATSAEVEVRVDEAADASEPALAKGETRTLTLGSTAHLFPIRAVAGGLVSTRVTSVENVGIAVEAKEGDGWRTVDTASGHDAAIQVRAGKETEMRLRVWSLDGRGEAATVRVESGVPPTKSEAALRGGMDLRADEAVRVTMSRPGTFQPTSREGLRWCPTPGERCREVPDAALSAPDGELWLVGGAKRAKAVATRVVLDNGSDLRLRLADDRPAVVDIVGAPLVTAEANGGIAGVRAAGGTFPSVNGMAVATDRTVELATVKATEVRVFRAAGGGPEGLDVRLHAMTFGNAKPSTFTSRRWEGELAPGMAANWEAPPYGERRIHLALAEGLIARRIGQTPKRAATGAVIDGMLWASDGGLEEDLPGSVVSVSVVNPTDAPLRYAMEIDEGSPDSPVLPQDAPFEQIMLTAGTLHRAVAGDEGGTLHVRGALTGVTFVHADGRVESGRDIPLHEGGGSLTLRHDPGLILAWVDTPGHSTLWGPETPPAVASPVPRDIALTGTSGQWSFATGAAGMLHLRAPVPVVARWSVGGKPKVEVFDRGALIDLPISAAPLEVWLRAIAGGTLSGRLHASFHAAIPATEGAAPDTLLIAGDSRLYSFDLDRSTAIGIGVRDDGDVASCTLYDASGNVLEEGVVMMPTLAAGRYLVAIHTPPTASPVRARLAIVGLKPPDGRPPREVIEQYLHADDPALAADRAARAEAEAAEEERRAIYWRTHAPPEEDEGEEEESYDEEEGGE